MAQTEKYNNWLIVGLGNPGREYSGSRHNVGYMCISHIAKKWGIRLSDRRRTAVIGQGHSYGKPVVLAKPRTFMNNSGDAVSYLFSRFSGSADALIVIYDDIDLPVGKLRIRPSGGTAGHNGIQSIIDSIGTDMFIRIRIGIGRPLEGSDKIQHVLSDIPVEEIPSIRTGISMATEAVAYILSNDMQGAMNYFN